MATLTAERPEAGLRRLSSTNVSTDSLKFGGPPAVVVPPAQMDKGTDASEIATAMELARQQLEGLTTMTAHDGQTKTKITDEYAFAFDIDGVLIRGGEPIPQAVEAMKMLTGQNNHGIKV